MSLRWKVLILLSGVSVFLAVTTLLVQSWVVGPSFRDIEHSEAMADLDRCREGLRRDLEHLATTGADWGVWDETYQFAHDDNKKYKETILIDSSFTGNKLNLIAFIRPNGQMLWGQTRDRKSAESIEVPGLLADIARAGNPLLANALKGTAAQGIIMTAKGPMLLASQPILKSDGSGPVRGTLVMGRFLDKESVEELGQRTRVDLSLTPTASISSQSEKAILDRLIGGEETIMVSDDPSILRGYAFEKDIFGKPALLMEARLKRDISKTGSTAAHTATICSLAGGLGIMLVLWFGLSRMVVKPLSVVTRHAERVGSKDDLKSRLNMTRPDEIGQLAREFDHMVEALEGARKREMDASRRAGESEVATEVLHNVGNVLNTVNVSAETISAKLRNSELPTLGMASQMLLDHSADLGTFITQDPKGKQIPAYLGELAQAMTADNDRVLSELTTLTKAVEHIRGVVQSQQVRSGRKMAAEAASPAEIVEEAVGICRQALDEHGISLVKQFEATADVVVDRHKMLQILLNLISNAKHSVCDAGVSDKRITLTVGPQSNGSEHVSIAVTDNGIGIPPENISRVFTFGFTTRDSGHGYGLHSAINNAREMSGSLGVHSDGVGKGATFTLTLPTSVQKEVK